MSAEGEKRFLIGTPCTRGAPEIAKTLYKIPALLTTWTRCGKPACRCKAGRLHGPYHALHWRDGTIQRRRYVRTADTPAVRAILEKRREQRATERLALALSTRTWRELCQWVVEYEASLDGERTEL